MINPAHDEDDQGEVFLDESDIIHEVTVDDEDLPDVDDDEACSDVENEEQPDDSAHIFNGHNGEVYSVACSPIDATLVATGGKDDRGFLWRINQGDWASEIRGRHKNSVSSLAFSTDGQLLASGDCDGVVQIWDTSSGNLKCALDGPGKGIEWVRWHPRGHLVLAGSEDHTVWMWNADRGAYFNMFLGHANSVTCGDFTPDGKTICTGSGDATLRIWDPIRGENHVVRGHPYHTMGLTCLTISSDSTLVLTGSEDSFAHLVNITTGTVVSSLPSHTRSIECVAFSPSSPWAATGSMDKKLIIWDLQHSSPRHTCNHEGGVACVTWLGTSRFLITGCLDGKVQVWDSLSGECVRSFSGHTDGIQGLSVSADQEFLVSVSLDGTARVFEISEFR